MDKSTAERLLEKQLESKKQEELIIERLGDFKKAIDRIFSTPEGKMLGKYWIKHMRLFHDDPQINPAQLVGDKERRSFYLRYIRPHLDRRLRMNLENQ